MEEKKALNMMKKCNQLMDGEKISCAAFKMHSLLQAAELSRVYSWLSNSEEQKRNCSFNIFTEWQTHVTSDPFWKKHRWQYFKVT